MIVFLDTNIILDFYDNNRGHYMTPDTWLQRNFWMNFWVNWNSFLIWLPQKPSFSKLPYYLILASQWGGSSFRKEAKGIRSLLWRRERTKETSTLTKPLPIWRGCNRKVAETDDFSTILVSRDTAWIVYRLALRDCQKAMGDLLFEKKQKEMSFSFLRPVGSKRQSRAGAKKRTKRNIHPHQASPYMERM